MRNELSVLALLALAACTSGAGGIGGADYAPQYDFFEFWAATEQQTFRVETAGNSVSRHERTGDASPLPAGHAGQQRRPT